MDALVLRANASHLPDALALFGEYYEAEQIVKRESPLNVQQYVDGALSGIWLIYSANHPAGCVLFRPLEELESAGEVKRLYVRPEYRGHGFAHKLMDAVESFARSQGMKWLYLDSREGFAAALHLYHARGFLPCPNYNDNPEATIFMRKNLATA